MSSLLSNVLVTYQLDLYKDCSLALFKEIVIEELPKFLAKPVKESTTTNNFLFTS